MGNKTWNEYVRLDYEQSLFFLVYRAKRARRANDHASPLDTRARALLSLNLKKNRDCSQSNVR